MTGPEFTNHKFLALEFHVILAFKKRKALRGQRAEARRTTILQLVEGKPHSQKDRQNENAEDFVPDEGTG